MSPDFDFQFLATGLAGLASANEILSLRRRSKEAAWRLYIATHDVQTERVVCSSTPAQKKWRQYVATSSDAKDVFFHKLLSLNNSDKLKLAL